MTSGEPARGNAAGSWYGSDGPDRLNSAQKLKHLFRVYCYADARFSPSFKEGDATYRERVSASRMDDDDRHPVICTSMTSYALLGAAKYVGRHLAARRVLFLVWFTSSMRREASARRTLTALSVYRRAFPNHDFVFLCNEEEERIAFAALGMNAILCSHNALADDAFWRPGSGKGQTYDALYNGSMTLQKRRHLARLVPRAAHVFAEVTSFGKAQTFELLAEMRRLMPTHDFLNPIDGNKIVPLSRDDVKSAIAASATGLCLSESEGAMFASIEYLLAGRPVVSTFSTGGRDIFGTPETWLNVSDTAEAVRDGVTEMKLRRISAERIREITLAKIYEHRARLREAVLSHTNGAVALSAAYSDPCYRRNVDWIDGPTMVERFVTHPTK